MGSRKLWGWMAFIVLVFVLAGGHKTGTQKAEHQRVNRKAATHVLGNSFGAAFNDDMRAVHYQFGAFGPQNSQKALFWFKKAAAQNNATISPRAEDSLGGMYFSGIGVPQNYVDAYMWFALAKATANPFDDGKTYRRVSRGMRRARSYLTTAEVARAQSMAAAWEKSHEK